MLRFGETKVTKERFYAAKKPIKIWDVDIDNIVISTFAKTKTNSKYLIGNLDKVINPLVLLIPKMSGYVKTFKVNDKSSTCMSVVINGVFWRKRGRAFPNF